MQCWCEPGHGSDELGALDDLLSAVQSAFFARLCLGIYFQSGNDVCFVGFDDMTELIVQKRVAGLHDAIVFVSNGCGLTLLCKGLREGAKQDAVELLWCFFWRASFGSQEGTWCGTGGIL